MLTTAISISLIAFVAWICVYALRNLLYSFRDDSRSLRWDSDFQVVAIPDPICSRCAAPLDLQHTALSCYETRRLRRSSSHA